MSEVKFKGSPVQVDGSFPSVGAEAADFQLTAADLSDRGLAEFAGKRRVLNIFPSIDTPTCAASVRRFNEQAGQYDNTVVLCISADLPFAQARFCGAEGLSHVITLSTFRSKSFARDYGVAISSSKFAGLTARAVVVLDESNKVVHSELVGEIANEPDYAAVLSVLK